MILDRFRVTDQVAVVTGAGRGIGAATAVGLAEAGADVVIASRTESDLRAVADRVTAAGRRAHVVVADLTNLDQVTALATTARDVFGHLDVVVNNVGGSIVNVSSMLGRISGRGFLVYGTAKAALEHYTRLAAADLAPRIRVNAVAMGTVDTPALQPLLADDEVRGQVEAATPLRRVGRGDDAAAAVVYLVSAAAGYVTGKVIEVDGGAEWPPMDAGLPDL